MNKKAMLISAIAFVVGIVLMQLYIRRLEYETSGGPPVSIVIAVQDILPGSAIQKQNLGIREIPQAYLEQRHIRAEEVEKVLGANPHTEIQANESLLWTDVENFQRGNRHLSDLVQAGMRAIIIEAKTGVFSGLIRPGDRVDVLFTEKSRPMDGAGQSTYTLLQNLIVLAVGSDLGDPDQHNISEQASSNKIALSVSIEQGQLITQAEHQGELKLILRHPDDIVLVQDVPKTTKSEVVSVNYRSDWNRHESSDISVKEIDHVR